MRSTVRVLIVDDSALIRQMLTRALTVDPRVEVVGTARTGVEAIERATELEPDVVTLDIQMPELSGLEALPHIIRATSARVVMLSSVDDPDTTYQALALGAVDFIPKPKTGFATSLAELSELLLKKIHTAYRIDPARRVTATEASSPLETIVHPSAAATSPAKPATKAVQRATDLSKFVVIAASTGGPPALEQVFAGLDASLPACYLVVQHLPAGFAASLVRRLARVTDIEMLEGFESARLRPGVAYIAPYGTHMTVRSRKLPRLMLEEGPSLHGVRPAADPLFASAAEIFGDRAIGVVLTGMGSDGARGLRAILDAGGHTIAQDEGSSVVWGMPRAAARTGAASLVTPLDAISSEIRRAIGEVE